jgi:hypothetical protein
MRLDFAELFAFCELHASRLRPGMLLPMAVQGFVTGPRYFDRQGFPIPAADGVDSTLAWARMLQDPAQQIVARDELPDGSRLSTVWLGLDHGFGGPPLIFETMRFSADAQEMTLAGPDGTEHTAAYSPSMEFPDPFGEPGDMTEQLRYTTEEEALAAHHEILRRLRVRLGH